MTIFMGFKTEDFAFGAIDSRVTFEYQSGQTSHEDYDCKIFKLNDYYLSFASLGLVLDIDIVDQGLKAKIDSEEPRPYDEIITQIVDAYKHAYSKQNSKDTSVVMIFGYDPIENTPFMYKYESPQFIRTSIPSNSVFFRGADEKTYKEKAEKIFENHFSQSTTVNLLEWATQTFEAQSHNNAVGYPYVAHLYQQTFSIETPPFGCNHTGDIISANDSNKYTPRFNVKLED